MTQTILRFKFIKASLIWTLLLGLIFTSCSDKEDNPPPPADKTDLQASVTAAQALYDGTVEGTKPGQYVVGSKTAFGSVLDQAKAVLADPNATQTAVTNANAQLQAATTAYQGNKINEIAAANLIGFWKFNGNANDSSGNSNNGVVTAGHTHFGAGTPTLTADRFARTGMAYQFDKGGNVNVPYQASLNPPEMTISLWAKWTSTGRTVNTDTYTFVALNRWNGYKFQLQSGHLPFYTVKVVKGSAVGDTTIYDRDPTSAFPIAENTWRHLVVTFKSGFMSFYIDGDLAYTWDAASSRPVPGNAFTLASPIDFVIGQDLPTSQYLTVDGDFQVAWGGFFTGDMDDVMFYNIALDGPQVHSIFVNQNTL